jgi:hypothetical protein
VPDPSGGSVTLWRSRQKRDHSPAGYWSDADGLLLNGFVAGAINAAAPRLGQVRLGGDLTITSRAGTARSAMNVQVKVAACDRSDLSIEVRVSVVTAAVALDPAPA